MKYLSLRNLLILAAAVGLIFGVMFYFAPGQSAESFNVENSETTRLLARNLGGFLIAVAALNWFSRNDRGSMALKAVVIANILIHSLTPIADWISGYNYDTGEAWLGVAIHLFFFITFGYYLLNWDRVTKK